MTKAKIEAARRKQVPNYILNLSQQWDCDCMAHIIHDFTKGKFEIEEMYCRIVSFLVMEINGQEEAIAEKN